MRPTPLATILALGDSHAAGFRRPELQAAFPHLAWDCVVVPGATASGLENPNDSQTRAYPTFRDALANSTATRAVVTLGEVDTGFVVWYRAFKYAGDVFTMLDRAVAAYGAFLDELGARLPVLCLSAALPTLRDEAGPGEVANARRLVRVPQRARTALTLEFNRRIRRRCQSRGHVFIDLDPESLGPDGLVRRDLLHPNPGDHHYEPGAYARLLLPHLRPHLALAASPAFFSPAPPPYACSG